MLEEPSLTPDSLFIAGDWGTTHLRLFLCRVQGVEPIQLLATEMGPGVGQIGDDFEPIFFDLVAAWVEEYGVMPVILSGMVGSNIGWRRSPYIDCPVRPEQIIAGRTAFRSRDFEFSLIHGLRTQNPFGSIDLMRGEELQLLGWMAAVGASDVTRVVALPGTHNKWALIKGDTIETFITSVTGEVYSLLQEHSVLITSAAGSAFSSEVFLQGVEVAKKLGPGQLLQALFSVRSGQVEGQLSALDASCYLSGLLIASDIIGSLGAMEKYTGRISAVDVIGDAPLSDRYQRALAALGVVAQLFDATQIAMSGYRMIYQSLYADGLP